MGRREINFKSSGVSAGDPDLLKTVESRPIGIKTPIELGEGRSGIFQMHFDPEAQLADNLKNLILTNWGERLGNYTYGANLRPLTVELSSQETFEANAMERISLAVSKHMPFVTLETFSSDSDLYINNQSSPQSMTIVNLVVKYSAPSMRITNRSLNIALFCA